VDSFVDVQVVYPPKHIIFGHDGTRSHVPSCQNRRSMSVTHERFIGSDEEPGQGTN
jgi:hypothetical protein